MDNYTFKMDNNTFKIIQNSILEREKIISHKSLNIEELVKQIKIQSAMIDTFKDTINSYAKMNEDLKKEVNDKNTAILCIKDDLEKCKEVCENNDIESDIINGLKLKLIVTNSRLADALIKD